MSLQLYVWEDTGFGGGYSAGGTLAAIAGSPDQAREKIRQLFRDDPWASPFGVDMASLVRGDGLTGWQWLEEELASDPSAVEAFFARGGD